MGKNGLNRGRVRVRASRSPLRLADTGKARIVSITFVKPILIDRLLVRTEEKSFGPLPAKPAVGAQPDGRADSEAPFGLPAAVPGQSGRVSTFHVRKGGLPDGDHSATIRKGRRRCSRGLVRGRGYLVRVSSAPSFCAGAIPAMSSVHDNLPTILLGILQPAPTEGIASAPSDPVIPDGVWVPCRGRPSRSPERAQF